MPIGDCSECWTPPCIKHASGCVHVQLLDVTGIWKIASIEDDWKQMEQGQTTAMWNRVNENSGLSFGMQ